MRQVVFDIVGNKWCHLGYNELLKQRPDLETPILCKARDTMQQPELAPSGWYKGFIYDAAGPLPVRHKQIQ